MSNKKKLNGVLYLFQTSHIKLWQETRIFVGSNAFYLCGAYFVREDKFETLSVSVITSLEKAAYVKLLQGRYRKTYKDLI